MLTFSNKYNIGDTVEYIKMGYSGAKSVLTDKIRRIICIKTENSESILYLIGDETVSEDFIKHLAAI